MLGLWVIVEAVVEVDIDRCTRQPSVGEARETSPELKLTTLSVVKRLLSVTKCVYFKNKVSIR